MINHFNSSLWYSTRSRGILLRIERVRSENGRKSFKVAGALTFNDLPVKIRNETSITKLKHLLNDLLG